MGQKIKRTTQCGNQMCNKSFAYHFDLEQVPAGMSSYSLACPFCQTRQSVALHSVRTVDVLRGSEQQEITQLSLPEHPVGMVEEPPPQPFPYQGRE